MIFRWIFLLLFALALPCTALAGSYRVIFGGAITSIGNGAPDSFSIGERVLGTYEFSTEPEWRHTEVIQFTVIDRSPLAVQPITYNGAFPDIPNTLFAEAVGTGPLLLMTESGFVATDSSSEIYSAGGPSHDAIRFVGSQPPVASIGNRGLFSNSFFFIDPIPKTLHTFLGPVATGIQLFLKDFDLSPAQVADESIDKALQGPFLLPLLDPLILSGIERGVISFGPSSTESLARHGSASVSFDIDSLRIVAIPEPATLGLLLFAMVAVGAGRRTNH